MKIKHKGNSYKKVPEFWWDFSGDCHIVVESDSPKFPIIKYICFNENADYAIELAEKLICDLKEGRISLFYEKPMEECLKFIDL